MEFNPQKQLAGLLEWMDQQMALCHGKTAVIGISGGKDSSTVAALAVAAYGRENVYGVLMPNGVQPDIDYSQALVEHLNIPHCTINIHDAVQGVPHEMEQAGLEPSRQTRVNLPSRIRMATLYAVAQTVPDGIVINTSNLSEDWVGYCTIYGDSAGAFSPLGMYTTEEVIALGRVLGLPEKLLVKAPSDGLTGLTDEDNLGFTYHAVNEYARRGVCDPTIREQIDRKTAPAASSSRPCRCITTACLWPLPTKRITTNKKKSCGRAAGFFCLFVGAEGVDGPEGIVAAVIGAGLEADALHPLDLLEIAHVGLLPVGGQPDVQNAQSQAGQQDPPDEGKVQHKQRPLEARCLGLAHADGLHDADVGIFAQVIHREAVPVLGDEAGDIEQQRPQEHEDAHNDVQQDQLPQETEPVQQAGEGHFLAPAHAQVIDGPAGAENCLGQPVHRPHKGHQQHRELRKAGQHRRQVGVIACHLVHGLGRPHIGVQPAQQAQNPHNDQ